MVVDEVWMEQIHREVCCENRRVCLKWTRLLSLGNVSVRMGCVSELRRIWANESLVLKLSPDGALTRSKR